MDQFICETLDLLTIDLKKDAVFASFVSTDGLLKYNHVLSNKSVLNNLAFCWTWRQVFGIYPSKLQLIDVAHNGANIGCFHGIVDQIARSTFYKFAAGAGELEKMCARLSNGYDAYVAALKQNRAFVKEELVAKLRDRLAPFWKVKDYSNLTLFQIYSSMINDCNPYVEYDGRDLPNPITGFFVPINDHIIGIDWSVGIKISRHDLAKAVFNNDNYFCRLLCQGPVLTAFGRFKVTDKLARVGMVIGVDASIQSACANAFVCSLEDLINSARAVPQLAPINIVFYDKDKHNGDDNWSGFSKTVRHMVCASTAKGDDTFNLLAAAEIDTLISGGDGSEGSGGMPIAIQKCIVDLYERVGLGQGELIGRGNANCVLLIDNRRNMQSVMSTCISVANLKKDMWDLVILTSRASRDFYKAYFPNALFLTMDSCMEFPFNIETYNRLLKDPQIWASLKGYTKCLLVQDDGMLIRPGLEATFMDYDYVGAPWPPGPHLVAAGVGKDFVGNGGLSLRDVRCMLDITTTCIKEKMVLFNTEMQPVPEDVYFSAAATKLGKQLPSRSLAEGFAMEMYKVGGAPLGFHKPWPYIGEQATLDFLHARLAQLL